MIIDCFTFNGEYDLLEIRLNILNDYVDQFVIVEAPTTFSGKEKPLYYELQKDRYKKWHEKIKYFVIDESYSEEEVALAYSSPNTQGADHWKHEFLQKESIKKALTHLNDDDVVFVGDCDEIWFKEAINILGQKLKLKCYIYYFNQRSTEVFWGGLFAKYETIKNSCLNHLRTNSPKTEEIYGWHFTSLKDILRRKLEDSYTEDTYASPWVMNNLETNVENDRDFLGRNHELWVDESELPKYLLDNKEKYGHLFK